MIGHSIYRFDENRRVYQRDHNNHSFGAPIWREHWRRMVVIGETTRSWVVGYRQGGPEIYKVPKKDPLPRGWAWDENDINRRAWVHDNRHCISREVERIDDYDKLQAVAKLIGYKENQP